MFVHVFNFNKRKMKKLLFSLIAVATLFACSNNEDESVLSSAESKKEVSLKNTDGTIISEIPTDAFKKIISNLKNANEDDKITTLNANYKDDNGTTKLISSSLSRTAKSTAKAAAQVSFSYRAHVQSYEKETAYGWQEWLPLGTPVGTTGLSRRLEALQFANNSFIVGFQARAHVTGKGWLPYVGLGDIVGTAGEGRRAEAFQINVPASFATQVLYRVYVQNLGWMDFVNNGEIAGTTGKGLRVEAFQMHMVVIE